MVLKPLRILVILGIFGWAQTGLSFPSDEFWIPQTRTLVQGEVKWDLQVLNTLDKGTSGGHQSAWGLGIGAFETDKFSVEVGGDWREPSPGFLDSISTHGRVAYNDLNRDNWSIALGFDRFALKPGTHDNNLLYVAFQNRLSNNWTTEIGGFAGNEVRLRSSSGVMLGVWKPIQGGHGNIGLEWMTGQGVLGYLTGGIKAEVREGVLVLLSYGFANQRDQHLDLFQTRVSIYF